MNHTSNVRAEFFRDPHGRDMVRIAIIGDPSVYVGRAEAAHAARFPREFAAFEAGRPVEAPAGLPLESVPGVAAGMAAAWRARGVRTAQELAGLSDLAAKSLGLGALGARHAARALLAARRAEAIEAAPGSPADPAPDAPTIPDLVPPAAYASRAGRGRGRS